MSRKYLDEIANDIADSYAKMTGQDSSWKKHMSLPEFFELRKQAMIEIEKNFSFDSSNNDHSSCNVQNIETKPMNNQQSNEIHNEIPRPKEISKPIETPKEKQENTKPLEITQQTKTLEEPKVISNDKQSMLHVNNEIEKEETPIVNDKKHDQEELELFSRLKY